ncbi:MFS transporter, partial [uncultured Muribaculum sp.]
MWKFLAPPAYKAEMPAEKVDSNYKKLRWQVFLGIFIGYAGFYIVRKNFSMAIPELAPFGFETGELSIVLSMNAIAYALSKFLMGSVSDRSNARVFLPLGLVLAAISMAFMIVPVTAIGPEHKMWAIALMAVLNFLVGWFNGMGWPPCGRVMTHWFSIKERGTKMSIWNCAHNVGGALVGPMAVYGAIWFGSWFYGSQTKYYFLIGTYAFPAAVAIFIAILAYILIRDTPQSCGLPSIEKYRNDYPKNYSEKHEQVLTAKEIFFKYVFNNKMLWFIAIANAFVYMVRYGCLDWAPAFLKDSQGYDIKDAGWAYFAYEFAAIPGTLVCGWLSDKVFKGRRAITTIIFMALVAVFILLYWRFSYNYTIVTLSLIGIGFFIYGPVMLIGVQALDLAPKNAAGT